MYQLSGKTTDKFIKEEEEITLRPNKREHDVLVSVGEQITISKLVMCLEKKGYKAKSFTGWQLPILTNSIHGNARIEQIDTSKINECFENNTIVVIAGFQGVDLEGDITTLGRGGSDTTAVAIAAALEADRCDIFTDVDGVYSADPRIINDPVKIESISYDEMLELASMGAKVLHNRCVEIGKKYNVPICVKSTFEEKSIGTIVTNMDKLEKQVINGITSQKDIVRITIIGKEHKIGRIYKLFDLLSNNDINVDMIVQSFGEHLQKDVSFTIKKSDLDLTMELLNEHAEELNIEEIQASKEMEKISLIGIGLSNNSKIISSLFETLYENNVNMHMISTSEIKISILVNSNVAASLIKELHNKFIKELCII